MWSSLFLCFSALIIPILVEQPARAYSCCCLSCMLAGAPATSVDTAPAQLIGSGSREADHSISFLFRSALVRRSAAVICTACSGVISPVFCHSCYCSCSLAQRSAYRWLVPSKLRFRGTPTQAKVAGKACSAYLPDLCFTILKT